MHDSARLGTSFSQSVGWAIMPLAGRDAELPADPAAVGV